jgi:hypothetical protein
MARSSVRLVACPAVVAAIAAVSLVTGCSSGSPTKTSRVVTVTVPPSNTSTATQPAPTASSRSTPSPTSAPIHLTKLKGTCDTLLPDGSIIQAIGGAPLAGVDAFVVGQAEPDIGRIGYLNCRYGVTGTAANSKPKIEVGVSLYSTSAQAAARITATVDDYSAHGATAAATTVDGVTGTTLTGGVGVGYTVPLLVVASGQRTVAVSVDPAVATGAKATSDATAIAKLALDRTGG